MPTSIPADLIAFLPAAAAALLGLAIGALVARVRAARREAQAAGWAGELKARLDERAEHAGRVEAALEAARSDAAAAQGEGSRLRAEQAALAARAEAERAAAAEKLALVEAAEVRLREAFNSLSAEALRRNNQSFLDLAKASLGEFQKGASGELESRQKAVAALVDPIRDSLQKVGLTLDEVEKKRLADQASIKEQLRAVALAQGQLQAETGKLVNALRAPAVRGRWGEIQLRRVVELAGMLQHCDFAEQESIAGEDGRLRPDMIVRLPGAKQVVVDSKVPLGKYLEAIDAAGDAERAERLREHARQVRNHMVQLRGKAYWDQLAETPEFVVMFLPGEMFFSAALEHDPSLIEFGVERKVIPASPTTLIAMLLAVAYGWRQEQLAENAQRISDLGRELHKRIGVLGNHFESLRRGLDRAVAAYNDAAGSLETRVLAQTRRFEELGAAGPKELSVLEAIDRIPRALHAELPAPAEEEGESSDRLAD